LIKLKRNSVLFVRSLLFYSIIIIHGVLSISRTIAIIDGYSAPIRLLTHSNTTKAFQYEGDKHINVCIGKDWYRFPSHFLLPEK
jgi:alpha-1,2-mannosyltransferase